MPEGPEVKTTVDFLNSYEGKKLTQLTVLSGRYTKKPIDNIKMNEMNATTTVSILLALLCFLV